MGAADARMVQVRAFVVRLAGTGRHGPGSGNARPGREWGRDLALGDLDGQSVWPFRIPAEEACAVPRGRLRRAERGVGAAALPRGHRA